VLEARARTVNERRARAALGVPGASLLSELLTSAELDQLAASARVEWLHAGEALFREGDASADLRAAFALVAGAVDVTVAPHDGGAKARRKFVASFSASGALLGEAALLAPGRRQATARVTKESAFVILSRSDAVSCLMSPAPSAAAAAPPRRAAPTARGCGAARQEAVLEARPAVRAALASLLACEGLAVAPPLQLIRCALSRPLQRPRQRASSAHPRLASPPPGIAPARHRGARRPRPRP
jgi:hypothetical protein